MSSDATDLDTLLGTFDPVVRPPVLPTSDVSYVVEDTAVGRMLLASTAVGDLVASAYLLPGATEELWLERLARAVSPRVLRQPAALDEVRRELSAYLAGERRTFDLRVDLALATPFQQVVLTGLRESVPYGERTTYGALARRIGRPSASRAVGAALGANPLCVVLPCHRVVASSGALTGYAGGLAAKERLLALESA
jgi:methylated-DNA-[protein]-cysteine S-methyltransferase